MNSSQAPRTIDAAMTARYDLYGPAHKCLRHAHAVMLPRLARADYAEPQAALLADLREHLARNNQHLFEEDTFIHPPLEARSPGATARLAEQHAQHRESFARLEELIQHVERARGDRAVTAGRHLYLAFTLFVADDLRHMLEEEQQIWPLLCSLFTDDEFTRVLGRAQESRKRAGSSARCGAERMADKEACSASLLPGPRGFGQWARSLCLGETGLLSIWVAPASIP